MVKTGACAQVLSQISVFSLCRLKCDPAEGLLYLLSYFEKTLFLFMPEQDLHPHLLYISCVLPLL